MAEKSFVKEIDKLRLGDGQEFQGEGILAVVKALLQSGVAYLGGYQGAPIGHFMDVLADAEPLLEELGVHFEASASEATAAATLSASVNYPLRGAVCWKSVVGTNVASDALSNLASAGVKGGALIIIGEDYGEGASILQERTHAAAMKSQMWLLDPRPNLTSIVQAVENGFELSEASNTPVMLQLRIRACHVHGRFIAKNNKRPAFPLRDAIERPVRDVDRIILPPFTFIHEREKVEKRWPAALKFIQEHQLNEFFAENDQPIGLIVQGGLYNTLIRALELLGLSDVFGTSKLPLYVMNVTYPLIDAELIRFCTGKSAVLLIEEGQPDFIEQALHAILRKADIQTKVIGKQVLPMANEYTGGVVMAGLRKFLEHHGPQFLSDDPAAGNGEVKPAVLQEVNSLVHGRPPGFCTGCPERPIFSAMKLVQAELGAHYVSADIGCHLFSALPPFDIGDTTMGYGLGPGSAAALNVRASRRVVSIMGDGGFWHNGIASGVSNAVFNRNDNVIVIVDNGCSAATGAQDLPSSQRENLYRSTNHPIVKAAKGVGVKWVRTITNTYNVAKMRETLRKALTTRKKGPKVIIAQSECMLNKQRRVAPLMSRLMAQSKRVVRPLFGVDAAVCTGDHSCIRLSGCPSLTIRPNPDRLRKDPVATVENSCVGCGLCGAAAHAAVLCPSFYRVDIVSNPAPWERMLAAVRRKIIGFLQQRADRKAMNYAA